MLGGMHSERPARTRLPGAAARNTQHSRSRALSCILGLLLDWFVAGRWVDTARAHPVRGIGQLGGALPQPVGRPAQPVAQVVPAPPAGRLPAGSAEGDFLAPTLSLDGTVGFNGVFT